MTALITELPHWQTLLIPRCRTTLSIRGEVVGRCPGEAVARVKFTAECGHFGVRLLCAPCLVRARDAHMKCTTHRHPICVVGVEMIGGTR